MIITESDVYYILLIFQLQSAFTVEQEESTSSTSTSSSSSTIHIPSPESDASDDAENVSVSSLASLSPTPLPLSHAAIQYSDQSENQQLQNGKLKIINL